MAYVINRSKGDQLVVVDDGILDSTTVSIGLVGRNYTGWGEVFNENFVYLLENFYNTLPPTRPLSGQTWYDSRNNVLKTYNGEAWVATGNATISETEPVTSQGGLWLKQSTNQLFVSDGTVWRLIGPEVAEGFEVTKMVTVPLQATDGNTYPVIQTTVNGVVSAIQSDSEFTIAESNSVEGFLKLYPGLTYSSTINSQTEKSKYQVTGNLRGNADTATKLESAIKINSVNFDGTQDITVTSSTTNFLKRGTYLLGSDFNGTTEQTWAVDATPDNRIGKLVARDANGDFSASTIRANLQGNVTGNVTTSEGTSTFDRVVAANITGTLTGNAATATKLVNSRKINTIDFDGTSDITLPVPAETLVGNTLASNILSSNLQAVGRLSSLAIDAAGLSIGAARDFQITVTGSTPIISSETNNTIQLSLKTGSVAGTSADISFISASQAATDGVTGPALVADWLETINIGQRSNIGTPNHSWNRIYVDRLIGSDVNVSTITPRSGNVTIPGSLTVTGTVAANLIGNVTGNISGAVTGNVSGAASLNLLKTGDSMTGDISWAATARGLTWAMNTDGASIKFYNAGDGDIDSRLEFNTRDNGNEYFSWTHTRSGSTFEGMRLTPNTFGSSKLTTYGNIEATGTVAGASLAGNGSLITNINANSISTGRVPTPSLSGTYNININGNATTATTASVALSLATPAGGFDIDTARFRGKVTLAPLATGGLHWPNDPFGAAGDTASITLLNPAGQDMRMTFKLTNNAGDQFEFIAPDNNGIKYNGHVMLHANNYNNYAPSKTGTGASGSWPIDITGNARTVTTVTNAQIVAALGYTPVSPATIASNGTFATVSYVNNLYATAGTIKAWVVFDGSAGAIISSLRVNSVTQTASGRYRITIASGTFSNGNYAVSGLASDDDHFISYVSSSATELNVNTTDNASGNNQPSTTGGRVTIMIAG